jgi:hypothetical protein
MAQKTLEQHGFTAEEIKKLEKCPAPKPAPGTQQAGGTFITSLLTLLDNLGAQAPALITAFKTLLALIPAI